MAAQSFSQARRVSGVKPWFLSTIVTGPRKWCFFIQLATSLLFITRAMAIIGRAKERRFVAASHTPWCALTSRMGLSVSSRRSLTAAGCPSETSRCSRQFSRVMTCGTRNASQMCPARCPQLARAMRSASFGSSVMPALRMLSTAVRRRFRKSGNRKRAKALPQS